nr:PorP/SprF family type IX secretion system membrane protein [uncultured Fluviicola sp.]
MNLTGLFIVLTAGLIFSTDLNAQQEPRSAFFWNNYMHTNPAMTGTVYRHHANAQWRNQWTKINGAPTTLWVNYATKIDRINSGIGVSYEYDVIGLHKSHTALLSYAYHIPIKNMFLSIGASGGIKTLKIDGSKFVFPQNPEPMFQNRQLKPIFQCDFGVALHAEKWNVGLSVTQLNGGHFKDSIFPYDCVPNFWVFADYTFDLGEKWQLTPRLQSYTDGKEICSSVALSATFKKNFWFGATSTIPSLGGRFSAGPMIGYDIIGKFRLGYSYEFIFNNSPAIQSDGTHEIILSYQLK